MAGRAALAANVSGNNAARLRTIQPAPKAAQNLIPAAGGAGPVSKRVERFGSHMLSAVVARVMRSAQSHVPVISLISSSANPVQIIDCPWPDCG